MSPKRVVIDMEPSDNHPYAGHVDMIMIHALLDSLFTIFSTMVNLKIAPEVPVPKNDTVARGHVSGMMVMQADQAGGSVALSFPLPAIRKISKNLLSEEIEGHTKEVQDLVGEITNMLVGGAKRIAAERGYDFDMQTPRLFAGEGHEISHSHGGQTVLLPIKMEGAEFFLELNFVADKPPQEEPHPAPAKGGKKARGSHHD